MGQSKASIKIEAHYPDRGLEQERDTVREACLDPNPNRKEPLGGPDILLLHARGPEPDAFLDAAEPLCQELGLINLELGPLGTFQA